MQDELARLSDSGLHVVSPRSNHDVPASHSGQPPVIVHAVRPPPRRPRSRVSYRPPADDRRAFPDAPPHIENPHRIELRTARHGGFSDAFRAVTRTDARCRGSRAGARCGRTQRSRYAAAASSRRRLHSRSSERACRTPRHARLGRTNSDTEPRAARRDARLVARERPDPVRCLLGRG
jgi:hypothetical protein